MGVPTTLLNPLLATCLLVGLGCGAGGPGFDAVKAYQQEASAQVRGGNSASRAVLQRFGGQTTSILSVSHKIESVEPIDEETVELVAVQTIAFRYNQDGPSRPEYSRSRHHVTMANSAGQWAIADLTSESL